MSELSFVNNIARGVDTLGIEYAPLIFAFARVRWESAEDRDGVLNWLAGNGG